RRIPGLDPGSRNWGTEDVAADPGSALCLPGNTAKRLNTYTVSPGEDPGSFNWGTDNVAIVPEFALRLPGTTGPTR
ncbi:MAG: hypothetical protein AAGK25_01750, partial [Pseudomonadota bacterium]